MAIIIMLLASIALMCYAACCVAHDADERAERMYREWKESKGADDDSNDID